MQEVRREIFKSKQPSKGVEIVKGGIKDKANFQIIKNISNFFIWQAIVRGRLFLQETFFLWFIATYLVHIGHFVGNIKLNKKYSNPYKVSSGFLIPEQRAGIASQF